MPLSAQWVVQEAPPAAADQPLAGGDGGGGEGGGEGGGGDGGGGDGGGDGGSEPPSQ